MTSFHLFLIDEKTEPSLSDPTITMTVSQFSTLAIYKELSYLDTWNGLALMPFILKRHSGLLNFLAEYLAKVFIKSLLIAVVPTDLRLASICPIHQTSWSDDDFSCRTLGFNFIKGWIFEMVFKTAFSSIWGIHWQFQPIILDSFFVGFASPSGWSQR